MEGRAGPLPGKSIKNFLRLPLAVLSIVILIAGGIYFFWSQYSYFTPKPSGPAKPSVPVPPSSEQATDLSGTSTPNDRPATVEEPQEKALSPSETWELEKIKDLLEKIRRANLEKNIDLFMSCYSADFKDREGRERAALKSWENFNYLSLTYDLKDHSISGDTAKVRVEWLIKLLQGPAVNHRRAKLFWTSYLRKRIMIGK